MQEYLSILGRKVKDKVTQAEGIADCVSFDLYGCVQVGVRPPVFVKDGKQEPQDARWFDFHRLDVTGEPVMAAPVFKPRETAGADFNAQRGPAEKPYR
jgi:hypothetical protein